MKKLTLIATCVALLMTSCVNEYNQITKSGDYTLKYEYAKQCYAQGKYSRAVPLLQEVVTMKKGSTEGEECLYMLAMAEFGMKDYETASEYFKKYFSSYPKGRYAENAKYYVGESLFQNAPEPRLDQSTTMTAIAAFQEYLDIFPDAHLKSQATSRLYALQDLLVEKEYKSARLYFDLGTYFGNCTNGGNNYEACIVTAQNALKDYPYSNRREEFASLVMKSKYELAKMSVESKQLERYQDAEDECYGFINEYPDSKERSLAEKYIEKCKEYEKAHPEDSLEKLAEN
ncbi:MULTISPECIES: outer membrane protein assembly factor BamD [Prevotellaceae]|uniref:outer membrane protein assembly factor BamD n=1 Tax=Prevotellaceae TaxID=171552 RepID=UPI001C394916|nr:outer membrane protein assembly factor BamD [Segatella copri]MBV3400254.1 outer membrane protein assembly factor BamD [Segatella copri]MBW0048193.1 outer membrane protein assembly factor BamD [Segatella copri]MDY5670242.1 outer membrane protein assembly factor BamD [Prevotella sp.]